VYSGGGGWSTVPDVTAWGGTRQTSSKKQATATVTFTAPANSVIVWVTPTGPGGAIVDVMLQGFPIATVDLSASTSARTAVAAWYTGAGGTRTLTIAFHDKKPAAGTHIDVDGFVLLTRP
jgi:hypothetical protein